MNNYYLIFKCRMCGQEVKEVSSTLRSKIRQRLTRLIYGEPYCLGSELKGMFIVHDCNHDEVGIADIIGARKEND